MWPWPRRSVLQRLWLLRPLPRFNPAVSSVARTSSGRRVFAATTTTVIVTIGASLSLLLLPLHPWTAAFGDDSDPALMPPVPKSSVESTIRAGEQIAAVGTSCSSRTMPVMFIFRSLYCSVRETVLATLRAFFLATVFAEPLLLLLFRGIHHAKFHVALLRALEYAGPTFIKLGQWASTRPDIFPPLLCRTLEKLHSNVAPHSAETSRQLLESSFSHLHQQDSFDSSCLRLSPSSPSSLSSSLSPSFSSSSSSSSSSSIASTPTASAMIDTLFLDFDPIPCGSGCIAQVHRATLRPGVAPLYLATPLPVAVKIRHPGVEDVIRRDLLIIQTTAKILTCLVPQAQWLSMSEAIDIFSHDMLRQLDLTVEARNLNRFLRDFDEGKTSFSFMDASSPSSLQTTKWIPPHKVPVTFPLPLHPLVTEDVLVETFEEGVPIQRLIDLSPHVFSAEIASHGAQAFLKMCLVKNFFHCDLHPGQILVRFVKQDDGSITDESIFFHNRLRQIHRPILSSSTFDLDSNFSGDNSSKNNSNKISNSNFNDNNNSNRYNKSKESNSDLHESSRDCDSDGNGQLESARHDMLRLKNEQYAPQLVFLDAGLAAELSPSDFANFIDLFRAVALRQGRHAAELMIERSRHRDSCTDPIAFESEMAKLIDSVHASTFRLENVRIGDVLSQVLSLVRKYQVKIESNFTSLVYGIMCLEGVGRQLDPSMDLFNVALPILHSATEAHKDRLLDSDTSAASSQQHLRQLKWLLMARKQLYGLKDELRDDQRVFSAMDAFS